MMIDDTIPYQTIRNTASLSAMCEAYRLQRFTQHADEASVREVATTKANIIYGRIRNSMLETAHTPVAMSMVDEAMIILFQSVNYDHAWKEAVENVCNVYCLVLDRFEKDYR